MKFTLYRDGFGWGNYSFRISNIPTNLKNRAQQLAKFIPGLTMGLAWGAQAASPYNAQSDNDTCPGNQEHFDYQSPQGYLYRLLVSDTYPMWLKALAEKGSISNLTQHLVTAAQRMPEYCGGKKLAFNLPDNSFNLVKHMLEMPGIGKACNLTALLRRGKGADQGFEACLEKKMNDAIFPWGWELGNLINSEPWYSMHNILWFTGLSCLLYSQYLGWLDILHFKLTVAPRISHSNETTLTRMNVPSGDIPDDFLCSITRIIMDDPVIAADGKTYERSAIQAWYGMRRLPGQAIRSPLTGVDITDTRLTLNETLKAQIDAFVNEKLDSHNNAAETNRTSR